MLWRIIRVTFHPKWFIVVYCVVGMYHVSVAPCVYHLHQQQYGVVSCVHKPCWPQNLDVQTCANDGYCALTVIA